MNQTTQAEQLAEKYENEAQSITYNDYYKGEIKPRFLLLSRHDSEENALTIENYPYGFTARTNIRYWIETTKNGDRFVSQTMNPKTGSWNASKKSTYSEVMVLIANQQGHVTYMSLHMNDDKTKAEAFLKAFSPQLSAVQIERCHRVKGWSQAMEKVTFTCTVKKFRNKNTGAIVTSVPFSDFSSYERVDDDGNTIDEEAEEQEKNSTLNAIARNARAYAAISAKQVN